MKSHVEAIDGVKVKRLTIERGAPNFGDLAWQTLTRLIEGTGLNPDHPGPDAMIHVYFRVLFGRLVRPWTVYANPIGAVRAPLADAEFLCAARRLQREWFKQFNTALDGAERARRKSGEMDPIIRQLSFTGVLFVDNRHVFPNAWPQITDQQREPPRIETGTRFGKLVVLQPLAKGKLSCRCDCGRVTVKWRRHVVSGRTKACGCTLAERQKDLQEAKSRRAWKFTGNLETR